MPKGKPKLKFGKQNLVDDELDAWEYADEHADYQRWEETQVKEGKEIPVEKPKKEVKAAPVKEEGATKESVKESVKEPTEETVVEEEKEIVLEQFDDWEAAMDALDAKISQEEAKKAAARNLK